MPILPDQDEELRKLREAAAAGATPVYVPPAGPEYRPELLGLNPEVGPEYRPDLLAEPAPEVTTPSVADIIAEENKKVQADLAQKAAEGMAPVEAPPEKPELVQAIEASRAPQPQAEESLFDRLGRPKFRQALYAFSTGQKLPWSFFEEPKTNELDRLRAEKLMAQISALRNKPPPGEAPYTDEDIALQNQVIREENVTDPEEVANIRNMHALRLMSYLNSRRTEGGRHRNEALRKQSIGIAERGLAFREKQFNYKTAKDAKEAVDNYTAQLKKSGIGDAAANLMEIDAMTAGPEGKGGVLTDPNADLTMFNNAQDFESKVNARTHGLIGAVNDGWKAFKNKFIASGMSEEKAGEKAWDEVSKSNPELTKLNSVITDFWVDYVHNRIGAQMTKSELSYIGRVTQDYYFASPAQKLAAIQAMRDVYARRLKADSANMRAYRNPAFQEQLTRAEAAGLITDQSPIFKARGAFSRGEPAEAAFGLMAPGDPNVTLEGDTPDIEEMINRLSQTLPRETVKRIIMERMKRGEKGAK